MYLDGSAQNMERSTEQILRRMELQVSARRRLPAQDTLLCDSVERAACLTSTRRQIAGALARVVVSHLSAE